MTGESEPIDVTPISDLTRASTRIQTGRKGIDFLVLGNNDEMNGYVAVPFEADFCNAVNHTVDLLSKHGVLLLSNQPQIGCLIINALVQVQQAVDAYRARMYKYVTDWGSEISPVGTCQRKLLVQFRQVLTNISDDSKLKLLNEISSDLKSRCILTYYWINWDRHDSSSICVTDLFTK